jgi:quercetin dioxygenase-like cupin family protein
MRLAPRGTTKDAITMRIGDLSCITLLAAGLIAPRGAGAQDAGVPVEREPAHQTVFHNRYLQAFRVRLAPGQASLMHTHTRDDAAVRLSAATTTSQAVGQPEGPAEPAVAGRVTARNNERTPVTHRVRNVGTTLFDVIDVQALERPAGPQGPAVVPPVAENPRMRVYRYELEPGARSAEHTHTRPYLRIAATAISLGAAGPGGDSRLDRLEAGALQWVDSKETHTLINAGSQKGILVEFEVR